MPNAPLVLVRHGATEWSATGRHTSHTDIPLTTVGEAQARAVGAALAGVSWSLVLSSPRCRAQETCRLAGLATQASVVEDLAEWDYGDYEGLTTDEIRQMRPGWCLWRDGVPGGELANDVGRRADRVIQQACAAAGPVVCFAHGHLLRVLAARWVGLPPAGGALLALGAGSISRLGWERESAVIECWNELALPAQ